MALAVLVEVVGGLLVVALGLAMAFAVAVGLLGITGALRLVRCHGCGRLGITSPSEPLRSCVRCRHGRLLHPLYGWHHAETAQQGARLVDRLG